MNEPVDAPAHASFLPFSAELFTAKAARLWAKPWSARAPAPENVHLDETGDVENEEAGLERIWLGLGIRMQGRGAHQVSSSKGNQLKNSAGRSPWVALLFGAANMISLTTPSRSRAQTWELLSPSAVPTNGTYCGVQPAPPFAFLPHPEWNLPVYKATTSNSTYYVFDDSKVDYEVLVKLAEIERALNSPTTLENAEGPNTPEPYAFGPDDSWIEILRCYERPCFPDAA